MRIRSMMMRRILKLPDKNLLKRLYVRRMVSPKHSPNIRILF